MSEEAKAKGNADVSPIPNHAFYSNRSAAHASLSDFPSALADAKKTVERNPAWPKGYSRLGAALLGLKDYAAAVNAYKMGLANEVLKFGLADANAAARGRARGSGEYEDCIKDCDKAVERGRELRSDFKMILRALTRKGAALAKMAKSSKDYEPPIETFQKALTEHRNPDTLKKLNDAERSKKELGTRRIF